MKEETGDRVKLPLINKYVEKRDVFYLVLSAILLIVLVLMVEYVHVPFSNKDDILLLERGNIVAVVTEKEIIRDKLYGMSMTSYVRYKVSVDGVYINECGVAEAINKELYVNRRLYVAYDIGSVVINGNIKVFDSEEWASKASGILLGVQYTDINGDTVNMDFILD